MAVEQLYAHYNHPRTAILMAHARGAIYLAAAQARIPVASYAATRVKKTLTGSGHAPKRQIQRAIQTELGLDCLPEPHDVADACAVALCHYYAAQQSRQRDSANRARSRRRHARPIQHPQTPTTEKSELRL